MLSIDLYVCDVVLKDGRDIDLECVVVRRLCLSWMELDVGVYLGRVEQDTDLWESSFREDDQGHHRISGERRKSVERILA